MTVPVIYLLRRSPYGSSILPSIVSRMTSGGLPSADGLHELAAPSRPSQTITRLLVVSYTTFSPLPFRAVIFFCRRLLSPIASIFGSGMPYAARTFLSCRTTPATSRNTDAAKVVQTERKTKENLNFLWFSEVQPTLLLPDFSLTVPQNLHRREPTLHPAARESTEATSQQESYPLLLPRRSTCVSSPTAQE